jgi:hypothetical protein
MRRSLRSTLKTAPSTEKADGAGVQGGEGCAY